MKTPSSSLQSVEQIVRRVIMLAGFTAAIILGVMMLLNVTDVAMRFLFNSPIRGGTEFTQYMMLCVGFFGLAWCALDEQHIKVDIIYSLFSKKIQTIFDIINCLIVLGLSVILGVQAISQSQLLRLMNMKSNITGIPIYPFYPIVTIGYFLLFCAVLILLIHTVSRVVKR